MMKELTKKVVVFDLDGTLLLRTDKSLHEKKHHFTANKRYIYLRPNLHHLVHHFDKLSSKAYLAVWTSMREHNATPIYDQFKKIGLKFERLYTQQHCVNYTKDLNLVARDFGVDVTDVYLVDDTPHKRVGDQNYMHVKTFDGLDRGDEEVLKIIRDLYQILELEFKEVDEKEELEKLEKQIHDLYIGGKARQQYEQAVAKKKEKKENKPLKKAKEYKQKKERTQEAPQEKKQQAKIEEKKQSDTKTQNH